MSQKLSELGMSRTRLDEIKLRLLGADHRPWILTGKVRDENGRPVICKGGKKASQRAFNDNLNLEAHVTKDTAKQLNQKYGERLGQLNRETERTRQKIVQLGGSPDGRHKDAKDENEIKMTMTDEDGNVTDLLDRAGYQRALSLFKLCDQATDEMADFVVHAPEDIDVLVQEIELLHRKLDKLQEKEEAATKEMLRLRIDNEKLQERLTGMRRAWRAFISEMGGAG